MKNKYFFHFKLRSVMGSGFEIAQSLLCSSQALEIRLARNILKKCMRDVAGHLSGIVDGGSCWATIGLQEVGTIYK
jgi:hypothetical protein